MLRIKNMEMLVKYGSEPHKRKAILEVLEETLNSLLPERLLRGKISFDGKNISIEGKPFHLEGKLFVIGTGKAAGKMAQTVEQILPVERGVVSIPRGTARNCKCEKIELVEASHPFPDEGSVLAAKKIIELSAQVGEKDLVVCLISGGGSSLLALPEEGISLDDKIDVTKRLMAGGADIIELNSVRKCLSAIKGGKLAMHFKHSSLINIFISDVVGNPLPVIASGPTVLDRYTYSEAKDVLKKYQMWEPDEDYCRIIEKGIMVAKLPLNKEKIKPRISNFVIGDTNLGVQIAGNLIKSRGFEIRNHFEIRGDARDVGKKFASLLNKGESFVAGGETTVSVDGDGIGGRNQELALSAAMHMNKGALASMGTDGIDGVSDAAGAIVDHGTKEKAKIAGLSMAEYLNLNDSYTFFKNLKDGSIITGPTGTNVCDLIIGLA
ncbi:MAG: DUF4147 domain-containing protein [Candidatus Micrarchaeota archaeon]